MAEAQASSRAPTFKADLLASIVVFLVALPLCMGVAIASGASVAAGLISGIVGGLIVGSLSGCPLQVTGPAAGLTVIVYDIIQQVGVEMLGLVVLVAGVAQTIAGLAYLGQWFRAVSPAVIKGMLAGIGFLILAGQFHVMMDEKPKGSGVQNLLAIPESLETLVEPAPLGSVVYRRAQIAASRDLRSVLAQQRQLREQANARKAMPTEAGDTEAEATDEPMPPTWEALAAEQESLTERLRPIVSQLEAAATNESDEVKAGLPSAATLAVQSSQEAAQAMHLADATFDYTSPEKDQTSLESLCRNHRVAGMLGFGTIFVILLWYELAPKKLKMVPAALVAVVLSTSVAWLFDLPISYVDVPANLWNDVHFPTWALMASAPWAIILNKGMLTAVVASAETLLSASAVDQLHDGTRTNYDRELFSQGVGNTVCGLLGALPVTGVIVRSSANVQAGAKTRLSTMLHSVWLLIFVIGLSPILRLIPTCSLAAILVYTGYKLTDPKSIRELRHYGWSEVFIYAATIGTIVFYDLLTGVLVGIGLSGLKLLYTFSYLMMDLVPKQDEPKTMVLHLIGSATFIRLPLLAAQLEKVPAGINLHVDFTRLDYIDHACLDLLLTWSLRHHASGGELTIDWESLHARFRGNRG